jgi:nicotinate-nucleotide pyrophosphorylase (carboxylating)
MQQWPEHVQRIVSLALEEDLGSGDITTNAIYSGKETGSAVLVSREDGVLAGIGLAKFIQLLVSEKVTFDATLQDGGRLTPGLVVARLHGPLAPILSAERTMLNFLQRMCGIASRTALYVRELESTGTRILDTRKTAPGHRFLDKMAVRTGGGTNHRMRLDDRFLIKENHIRMAGGIERAIGLCSEYREQHGLEAGIEIEVTGLEELQKVLDCGGVDYVMLDNMSLDQMREAVLLVDGRIRTEASGNVTLERLRDIAGTGVDYISSGALTHSVRALDISLLVDGGKAGS